MHGLLSDLVWLVINDMSIVKCLFFPCCTLTASSYGSSKQWIVSWPCIHIDPVIIGTWNAPGSSGDTLKSATSSTPTFKVSPTPLACSEYRLERNSFLRHGWPIPLFWIENSTPARFAQRMRNAVNHVGISFPVSRFAYNHACGRVEAYLHELSASGDGMCECNSWSLTWAHLDFCCLQSLPLSCGCQFCQPTSFVESN